MILRVTLSPSREIPFEWKNLVFPSRFLKFLHPGGVFQVAATWPRQHQANLPLLTCLSIVFSLMLTCELPGRASPCSARPSAHSACILCPQLFILHLGDVVNTKSLLSIHQARGLFNGFCMYLAAAADSSVTSVPWMWPSWC